MMVDLVLSCVSLLAGSLRLLIMSVSCRFVLLVVWGSFPLCCPTEYGARRVSVLRLAGMRGRLCIPVFAMSYVLVRSSRNGSVRSCTLSCCGSRRSFRIVRLCRRPQASAPQFEIQFVVYLAGAVKSDKFSTMKYPCLLLKHIAKAAGI
jgi:hypothetical protein